MLTISNICNKKKCRTNNYIQCFFNGTKNICNFKNKFSPVERFHRRSRNSVAFPLDYLLNSTDNIKDFNLCHIIQNCLKKKEI